MTENFYRDDDDNRSGGALLSDRLVASIESLEAKVRKIQKATKAKDKAAKKKLKGFQRAIVKSLPAIIGAAASMMTNKK